MFPAKDATQTVSQSTNLCDVFRARTSAVTARLSRVAHPGSIAFCKTSGKRCNEAVTPMAGHHYVLEVRSNRHSYHEELWIVRSGSNCGNSASEAGAPMRGVRGEHWQSGNEVVQIWAWHATL